MTTRDLMEAEGLGRKAPQQQLQAPEPHPADDDYAPPVSSVKLPSRGLVYPPDSPLYMCESVDVKAMSAKEENILSTAALIRKGTMLTTLMKACITNRSIDPDQMLPGDRNAILISIRTSAYGAEYQVSVTCPKCREDAEHAFDLSKLPIKSLSVMPSKGPGTNSFALSLPSERTAHFRLLNAADQNRLERDAEQARKNAPKDAPDSGVTMRLLAQVISIDGVPQEKLPRAVVNMPARDSLALRRYMDDIAPGVDMEQEYECPTCGQKSEVEVPISTEFFWPSGGR